MGDKKVTIISRSCSLRDKKRNGPSRDNEMTQWRMERSQT